VLFKATQGPAATITKIADEQSRRSMPVRWAWLDLNQRPHPKRKSPAYQRALSHQREPNSAGPPDSHPSWRPPAMGVLSAIEGSPLRGPPFVQVAADRRGRSCMLSPFAEIPALPEGLTDLTGSRFACMARQEHARTDGDLGLDPTSSVMGGQVGRGARPWRTACADRRWTVLVGPRQEAKLRAWHASPIWRAQSLSIIDGKQDEAGMSPPEFRTPWAALGPGLVVATNRPRRHCGSHDLQRVVSFSRPELERGAERDRQADAGL
jgi:hypothetical protein